jgi:hypothetical protein
MHASSAKAALLQASKSPALASSLKVVRFGIFLPFILQANVEGLNPSSLALAISSKRFIGRDSNSPFTRQYLLESRSPRVGL